MWAARVFHPLLPKLCGGLGKSLYPGTGPPGTDFSAESGRTTGHPATIAELFRPFIFLFYCRLRICVFFFFFCVVGCRSSQLVDFFLLLTVSFGEGSGDCRGCLFLFFLLLYFFAVGKKIFLFNVALLDSARPIRPRIEEHVPRVIPLAVLGHSNGKTVPGPTIKRYFVIILVFNLVSNFSFRVPPPPACGLVARRR